MENQYFMTGKWEIIQKVIFKLKDSIKKFKENIQGQLHIVKENELQ